MISVNGEVIKINHFPDGSLLLKPVIPELSEPQITIDWRFESVEEEVVLRYVTRHLQRLGYKNIKLYMPYIPNARMDRVKNDDDVFTLKYFAEDINSLGFSSVKVLDPHSNVSEALINNLEIIRPYPYIKRAIERIGESDNLMAFYPDEGAMKRYCEELKMPYTFGIKYRYFKTGEILSFDLHGDLAQMKGKDFLIVDDISSKGTTFYFAAEALKKHGANKVYLYVTHCENTILKGKIPDCGLIEKVFTTDSIYTANSDMVEVFKL